jgi:CBS domain containing-hemolysin-like protein
MIVLLMLAAVAVLAVLCIIGFVQILYLESLRLRTRELAALEFFKETLENKIGLEDERGALAFSLLKHSLVAVLIILSLLIASEGKALSLRAVLEGGAIAWLAMLGGSHVVPQILYRKTSGRWLLPLADFLRLATFVVWPVTALLRFLQSLFELGNGAEQAEEPATQEETIEAFIDAGAEEGIIEEEDRRLIQSVVEFGDKTVREVMTPRPNIVAIEQNRSLEELRQLVINEQYSRIPVYEETIDRVAGFVHVRDMFELDQRERERKQVKELMRPIRAVPESKKVGDLLREMQEDGAHMAVVIDEYGNTAGLATMEDLVEEVFGEIRDEHEPTRDVAQDELGRYVVSGSFDLDGLKELLDFSPPENIESTTVGGLVTEWFGRVPHLGERMERDGIVVEVLAGNELRVDKVRVSRPAEGGRADA